MNNLPQKIRMPRKWIILGVSLLFTLWIVLGVKMPNSAEVQLATSTPSPVISMRSLFEEDTCSPPCWFGLTPGESKIEDVATVFQEYDNLFGYDLNALRDHGYLPFFWRRSAWRRRAALTENQIHMTDGVVSSINIVVNDTVSLRETLALLGQPTYVLSSADSVLSLGLFYVDQQVHVYLDASSCKMNTLPDDFEVWSLGYYTPAAFEAIQQTYIGYSVVSSDVWIAWFSSTEDTSCRDMFEQQAEP